MRRGGRRFKRGLGPTLSALALLTLAGPAPAGLEGNLQPVGVLLLELDPETSQFRLDDGDAATADPVQLIFDQKILKSKDACLVGLTPDGSDPTDPNALVSLADSPTDWGIDTGKLALGGRTGKGAGCGQFESSEIGRIQVNSLLLTDASVQVEAKHDVAAKVTLFLDDEFVGTRYLLSGRAVSDPPAEIALAPPEHVSAILPRRDGGPDSKENDDGFWVFRASLHNIEVYEILTNPDGTQGKLSIKGGGEFLDHAAHRTRWTAFDPEGLLFCADPFSNETGTATGSRTNAGGCISRLPYDFDFDGFEMTLNVFDPDNQDAAYAFLIQFAPEPTEYPIRATVLAYDPLGVDCTGVDLNNPNTFTDSCIGMTLCEGTPIRRCVSMEIVSTEIVGTEIGCQNDSDCPEDSACQLIDLLPPPPPGWPDLVSASPTTLEYGCICKETVLPLGAGLCEDGSSCEIDEDCADSSTCEVFAVEHMSVEQCIFVLGDIKGSRRR